MTAMWNFKKKLTVACQSSFVKFLVHSKGRGVAFNNLPLPN